MNLKYNLILLKGEDKTLNVESIKYCRDEGKWEIYFQKNPKRYMYSYNDVEKLSQPQEVDLSNIRFEYQGTSFYNLEQALKFGSYFRLFFKGGASKLLHESELNIKKSCLENKKICQFMDFFTELSEEISIRSDEGNSLLGKQYKKIDFIGEDTVLAAYLKPKTYFLKKYTETPLIFPFGCNDSQKKAVQMTMQNQVSIIQGPPGTGKTQTILNIIANLLIKDSKIAVISNNNPAIKNVIEKMQKYGFAHLCALLGSQCNKALFLQGQTLYSFEDPSLTYAEWRESLQLADRKQREIEEYLALRNRLAEINSSIGLLKLEQKHFISYLDETFPNRKKSGLTSRLSSTQVLKLKVILEEYVNKTGNEKLNWAQKLRCFIQYKIHSKEFLDCSLDEILTEFERLYYVHKLKELEGEMQSIQSRLDNFDYNKKQEELTELSMLILKEKLAMRYKGYVDEKIVADDLWKNPEDVIFRYPIILSTTHSIRKSLSDIEYDYVIVDEASQVDLLTGILAMSCAKNMVIVGDAKQLPNVVPEVTRHKMEAVALGYQLPESMNYANHSLLSSIEMRLERAPSVILREHYRCHPRIIQFCNQKFYSNQLIIMTEDKNEQDVLGVYKTVSGNHARGRVNFRQIDEIKQTILPDFFEKNIQEEEIGIISPYRDQVEEMEEKIEQELSIDTVHKFQGREKEAIIIATVDNQITEFADNPNLLNVAVSRAVNKLRLVVSDNEYNDNTNIGDLVRYILYEKGEIVEGKVYSVFDLLYKEYAEVRMAYLKEKKRISAEESENLFYYFIQEVMEHEQIVDLDISVHVPVRELIRDFEGFTEAEVRYALRRGTHVDFLLFRKVDKTPIFAIEVDGYSYHKKGTKQGDINDKLKDSIFEKVGVTLVRFATVESGEDVKLRQMLQKYR